VSLGLSSVLCAALLVGCAPTIRGPLARPSEGFARAESDLGRSPGVIFEHSAVAAYYRDQAAARQTSFEEDVRRDVALGYRPSDARTAIDDWPQERRPSLDRARRTTLGPTRSGVITFGDARR
jgi:hypothetical protein